MFEKQVAEIVELLRSKNQLVLVGCDTNRVFFVLGFWPRRLA